MTQANVERVVREMTNAFNRGDSDGFLAHLDPSIEWWPATDEPITGAYRGHDGVRRAFAEFLELTPVQAEIEELIDDGDRAVVCLRYWGRGDQSGVPVEARETQVVAVRDGRVVEVREYRAKAEALEAVGLSE